MSSSLSILCSSTTTLAERMMHMSQRLTLTARRSSRLRGHPARIEIFGRFCNWSWSFIVVDKNCQKIVFYLCSNFSQSLWRDAQMPKCPYSKTLNKKLWETSNIPFLIFTIDFSKRQLCIQGALQENQHFFVNTARDKLFSKKVAHENNNVAGFPRK